MNPLSTSTPTRMLSKRKPLYRLPLIPVSALVLFLSFMFLYYYYIKPDSDLPGLSQTSTTSTSHAPQCSGQALALGEKFMWYAPHSGFSNQLSEFKHAVLLAGILNRTLVVPPILDHHAVALGSCPKFRVVDPKDLRLSVWDHVIELIRDGRLVSFVNCCQFRRIFLSLFFEIAGEEDWKQFFRCIYVDISIWLIRDELNQLNFDFVVLQKRIRK